MNCTVLVLRLESKVRCLHRTARRATHTSFGTYRRDGQRPVLSMSDLRHSRRTRDQASVCQSNEAIPLSFESPPPSRCRLSFGSSFTVMGTCHTSRPERRIYQSAERFAQALHDMDNSVTPQTTYQTEVQQQPDIRSARDHIIDALHRPGSTQTPHHNAPPECVASESEG